MTGPNGYRVEVTVPKKRGTFSANNRVYIRNVLVDSRDSISPVSSPQM